jgi:hypothetical protein
MTADDGEWLPPEVKVTTSCRSLFIVVRFGSRRAGRAKAADRLIETERSPPGAASIVAKRSGKGPIDLAAVTTVSSGQAILKKIR